ncbi:hypothetical protein Pint_26763 [Pistacia integerrima]|uniref:Uncharacterized protein n=1 Tax=Pistacia integerrima TaxID=434235 RepID=A0ACC0YUX8_9ROSI|nr:hypothetical protein Pint_26763 [Pistacia integerrima]
MEPLNPGSFTSPLEFYAHLLQRSLKSKTPFVGKSIHALIVKSGLELSVFLKNNLMNLYVKTGSIFEAKKVFDEMPVKTAYSWNTLLLGCAKQGKVDLACGVFNSMPYRDSVAWTTMIVRYKEMGHFENAIRMFVEMVKKGVVPNQFTVTSVLASCAAVGDLRVGKKVHSFVVKFGLSGCGNVDNSLFNMYIKMGDKVMAKVIFDGMRVRNLSSWNIVISLHIQSGRLDLARAKFELMSERDIVTWNSMIAGYNQHGYDIVALDIFAKMLKDSSLEPDKFSFGSVLAACAKLKKLKIGKEIHAYIVRTGFDASGAVGNALISCYAKSGGVEIARKIVEQMGISYLNVIAFTALLDGYIKLGDVGAARRVFDSLRDRDVVAWTAMIVGYEQNGLNNEAVDLFRTMIREGPKPNNYTLAAMLSVASSLASLDHGKQIHASALRSGQASSISVSNALITMYAKAGSINGARRIFDLIHWQQETILHACDEQLLDPYKKSKIDQKIMVEKLDTTLEKRKICLCSRH